MPQTNLSRAESYYQAICQKDLAAASQHLHSEVIVLSPLMKLAGKEAVLEDVKWFMDIINNLDIRAKFVSGNQVMLVFDLDATAPIGILPTAVLMTFKDALISRIELFFDARPLEKYSNLNAA
jgi:hypothetical protein